MSFASHEYLPFLVLVLAGFQFVPARLRAAFLLAASYAFYLWWSLPHAALLLASTLLDWGVGLGLGRATGKAARRALLGLSLAGNLGLLCTFKYAGFAADALGPLLEVLGGGEVSLPDLALPLGISFYTFQTIGYAVDVYRGKLAPCRDPVEFALYVSFFPQLVAGPIERAGHLIPQLRSMTLLNAANLSLGARRILWGLVKKWVLADHLSAFVRPVFERHAEHDSASLLLTAVGMNVLLYLDFSAYTDLARGSARLFGIELVENFRRPFVSRSLTEQARRWHMSLFTWIGDYVWSPLSGPAPGLARVWRANLVAMGLFGLWHGADWTFLVWGLCSGVAISIEHTVRLRALARGRPRPTPAPFSARGLAGWATNLLATSLFIVFFFSPDLGFALGYLRGLAAGGLPTAAQWGSYLGPLALFLAVGLAVHASGEWADLDACWRRAGWPGRVLFFVGLAAAVVWLRVPSAEPFIYFQF